MQYSRAEKPDIGQYCRWLGIYFLCLVLGAMNIGVFGSMLKLIAIVPAGIWLMQNHAFRSTSIIARALLYIVWLTATMVWSVDVESSASRVLTQWSFLLLLVSAVNYSYSDAEIDYLRKCLIWSSRLTVIAVIVAGVYEEGRIALSGAINEDPNYLCAYFLFGVVNDIGLLMSRENTKRKLMAVGELLIYAYIVFGTGSRGGVLAIVAAIAVFLLYYRDSNGRRIKLAARIALILVVAFGSYVVTRILNPLVVSRFTLKSILSSGGVGRYSLWRDALRTFLESNAARRLFGYGTASIIEVTYLHSFEWHQVTHNMFLETLLEAGIIGLALYMAHIASFFRSASKMKDYYSAAVLTGMLMLSMSTSISTFKPYWNIMLLIICLGCRRATDNEGETPRLHP